MGPKGAEMAADSDTLSLLRKLTDREHELLNSRNTAFSAWESILLVGFSWGRNTPPLAILIPVLGFLGALVRAQIANRTMKMQAHYRQKVIKHEEALQAEDRVYTDAQGWRRTVDPALLGIDVSHYFAYGFPYLWVLTWAVLFFLGH
jgi:hypothetical protein